jgi:hypothetical protein
VLAERSKASVSEIIADIMEFLVNDKYIREPKVRILYTFLFKPPIENREEPLTLKQQFYTCLALLIIVIGASVSLYRLGLRFNPQGEMAATKTITPIVPPKGLKTIVAPNKEVLPPILQRIAWCESKDHQFNPNGTVHRGVINPHDIGYFQINETFHLAESKRLGMNIYTLKGNIKFALWLYHKEGTTPWLWSSKCWSKKGGN